MDRKDQVKDVITRAIVDFSDIILHDIKITGSGQNRVVEVLIDTEDGVTIDECTVVSRRISDALDVLDPFNGSYRLEVASPGVWSNPKRAPSKRRKSTRTDSPDAIRAAVAAGGGSERGQMR